MSETANARFLISFLAQKQQLPLMWKLRSSINTTTNWTKRITSQGEVCTTQTATTKRHQSSSLLDSVAFMAPAGWTSPSQDPDFIQTMVSCKWKDNIFKREMWWNHTQQTELQSPYPLHTLNIIFSPKGNTKQLAVVFHLWGVCADVSLWIHTAAQMSRMFWWGNLVVAWVSLVHLNYNITYFLPFNYSRNSGHRVKKKNCNTRDGQ